MKTGEMLKNSAAMPVLEQWLFLACPDRYENDARWRIFNVLAWARPFDRFELLFSPDAPGECRVFLGWSERIKARPNQSKAAVDSAVAISALAAVRH